MVNFSEILKKRKLTPQGTPGSASRGGGATPIREQKEDSKKDLDRPSSGKAAELSGSAEAQDSHLKDQAVQPKSLFTKGSALKKKASFQEGQEKVPFMGTEKRDKGFEARVSRDLRASMASAQDEEVLGVYQEFIITARTIFSSDSNLEKLDVVYIKNLIGKVQRYLEAGNPKFLEYAVTYIIKEEDFYLYQHAVNTCIFSLEIGLGFKYDEDRLTDLGVAAFLHDIGMIAYRSTAELPRKISSREYDEIKGHVRAGEKLLKRIKENLPEVVLASQVQIHERLDGSGYPSGLKSITEQARIIAVADVFESMVHPRPFRPRFSIMDVYKKILDSKNKLDPQMIKILVERVGFFPNGSVVCLNTKETARVIRQVSRSPLRPVVQIFFDADGMELDKADQREIDLTKIPTIHVKKCYLFSPNEEGF